MANINCHGVSEVMWGQGFNVCECADTVYVAQLTVGFARLKLHHDGAVGPVGRALEYCVYLALAKLKFAASCPPCI